ncbi:MAG TPA: hypothetical protein VF529_03935 [Solirubrobacteraceae bacterium]
MTLRTIFLSALVVALLAPAASAATWSTGTYRGKLFAAPSTAKRGTVTFDVTRRRARIGRLSLVLKCTDGERRTFSVKGGGSGRLRPGPAGAGVSITARRKIDGWDVDWDFVGGIKGSTFRGNASASATHYGDDFNETCTLIGDFRARR